MKNKRVLACVLCMVLAVCQMVGCGNNNSSGNKVNDSGAPSEEGVYEFVLGTTYPDPVAAPENNYRGVGLQKFVDLVAEKTNGRVKITPHYDGLLGSNPELFEQIRMGEIDLFYGQVMSSADSRLGVFNIPFLFTDYEMVTDLIASKDAPLYTIVHDWQLKDNVKLLSVGVSDFRGYFNSKHRVGDIEDVRDLKSRIYEDAVVNAFWGDICNAVSMGMSEVYTSIQTGIIDGIDFPAPAATARGLQEICKYYSDIDWQWCLNCTLYMNCDSWSKLPADLQEIVLECAWEAVDYQAELTYAEVDMTYDLLESQGVEIYHLTDEERQTWKDYAATLNDRFKEISGEEAYNTVMEVVDTYNSNR